MRTGCSPGKEAHAPPACMHVCMDGWLERRCSSNGAHAACMRARINAPPPPHGPYVTDSGGRSLLCQADDGHIIRAASCSSRGPACTLAARARVLPQPPPLPWTSRCARRTPRCACGRRRACCSRSRWRSGRTGCLAAGAARCWRRCSCKCGSAARWGGWGQGVREKGNLHTHGQ